MSHPIKIRLSNQAHAMLSQMAKEAGMTLHDMAEVAVLNLIGLWLKEKGGGLIVDDAETP